MSCPDASPLVRAAVLALNAAKNSGWPDVVVRLTQDEAKALVEERQAMRAELRQLRGLRPEMPPRCDVHDDTPVEGLPRYGLRWNGPATPLTVPMASGYWTPWHLAAARIRELVTRQRLGEREG